MGTTAEKGAYIIGTKSLLKDKINNLGGSIDDNTTFRNYANQLQNVYDNLPKTEYQEGTEINLGKTIKGKLDYDNGVVGIGQSSQESTQGYNLFYINKADDSRTWNGVTINSTKTGFSATGQASASGGYILIDRYVTLQAGTYRLRLQKSTTLTKVGLAKTDYSEIVSIEKNSSLSSSFTLAEETNVCLRIVITNGETYDEENEVMIYSGTELKDFEQYTGGQASPNPSYPQTINSVTGNQDVVVSGKNLVEGIEYGDINPQDGAMYSSDSAIRSKNYITYDTSKTYYASVNNVMPTTLSLNLRFFNKSKEYIGYSTLTGSGSNFAITKGNQVTTTDLEPKYFKFRQTLSAGPITSLDDNVMIATISGATYEPYITPTSYQLSLGDIELNAIGNYKDELIYDVDEDKVYKKAYIGEATLNGVQGSFSKPSTNRFNIDGIISDYAKLDNEISTMADFYKCYANKTTADDFNSLVANENYGLDLSSGTYPTIRVKDTRYDNTDQYKAWLSANNVTIYYIKATPTLTELTDPTLKAQVKALYKAHSNNGTTIITSNGNLPMIIKVRALKGE